MSYEKYFENGSRDVVIAIKIIKYRYMSKTDDYINEINSKVNRVNSIANKYNYKLIEIKSDVLEDDNFKCLLVYEKDFKKENDEKIFEFISKAIDAKFKSTMDYLKKKEKNDLIANVKGIY